MEEKEMIISAVVLLAGLAILAGGAYYMVKEREDRESRKIYLITAVVGVVVAVGGAVYLFTQL